MEQKKIVTELEKIHSFLLELDKEDEKNNCSLVLVHDEQSGTTTCGMIGRTSTLAISLGAAMSQDNDLRNLILTVAECYKKAEKLAVVKSAFDVMEGKAKKSNEEKTE